MAKAADDLEAVRIIVDATVKKLKPKSLNLYKVLRSGKRLGCYAENVAMDEVIVQNSDISERSANTLVNLFSRAYRAAGRPDGVAVYYQMRPAEIALYFSGKAVAIGAQVLRGFRIKKSR